MDEDREDMFGDKRSPILRNVREQIEPRRPLDIARVEIEDVVRARAWDVVEEFVGEIAVRIEESDSPN